MASFQISPPITDLGVTYTTKCPIACRHCVLEASPLRDDKLSPSEIIPLIPSLNQYGIRRLLISGGEPSLFLQELSQIIQATQTYGWRIALFSNGFWAKSRMDAESWADSFARIGIHCIYYSTSRYHQEFIDIKNLHYAIPALKKHHISFHVYYHLDRTRRIKDLLTASELVEMGVPCSRFRVLPFGRARNMRNELAPNLKSAEQIMRERCALQNQLHIDQNGLVLRCCTSQSRIPHLETDAFFRYGDIHHDSIEQINQRMQVWSPIFTLLSQEGPGGICQRISNQLTKTEFCLQDKYFSQCNLCMDLLGSSYILHLIKEAFQIRSMANP